MGKTITIGMRISLGRGILYTTYVLFLALYVYSAAAYGLTRNSTVIQFEWGMGIVLLLWIVAHVLMVQTPDTGIAPWVASAFVLGFGWFVTGMGYIDDGIIDGRLPGWDRWFSSDFLTNWASWDAGLSLKAMTLTTVLLGAMLIAIEMWRSPVWAQALLLTMLLSSLGMVIFFFLQRIVGEPFLLEAQTEKVTLSFATYRYWGNAASYLNLFWPIAAATAVFAALRQSFGWPFWFIPAASTFVACFINVSKAGNVLAVIGLILFIVLMTPTSLHMLKRAKSRIRYRTILVALIPILIVAASLPFAIPSQRWSAWLQHANTESTAGRPHAYAVFLKMLPQSGGSGWIGFGPGTFQRFSWDDVSADPLLKHQQYWTAHQDYIQTAAEWGYIGTILWAFVLVPPGIAIARRTFQKPTRASRVFEGYRIGFLDHLRAFFATVPGAGEPCLAGGVLVAIILTALHSLVDFPMQIASLQLYFLTLLALGWSYFGQGKKSTADETDD
jgi:hypothetical protein